MKAPPIDGSLEPVPRGRGRPPLSRERIIATALQIVDEDGADALSMRTLAERLDSGTATLYRHFTDRADLVACVVNKVYGAIELDANALRSMGWQQAFATIARMLFNASSDHPNVARLIGEQVPMGPQTMWLREFCIAALLDNGFSPSVAALSWATLARYVVGFASQADRRTAAGIEGARQASPFDGIDSSRFPATTRAAKSLPVSLEDEFNFGLDLILTALSQRDRDKTPVLRTRRRDQR